MSRDALVFIKGYKSSMQLYILQCSKVIGDAAISCLAVEEVIKFWHMQFGHISENSDAELNRDDFLIGVGPIS